MSFENADLLEFKSPFERLGITVKFEDADTLGKIIFKGEPRVIHNLFTSYISDNKEYAYTHLDIKEEATLMVAFCDAIEAKKQFTVEIPFLHKDEPIRLTFESQPCGENGSLLELAVSGESLKTLMGASSESIGILRHSYLKTLGGILKLEEDLFAVDDATLYNLVEFVNTEIAGLRQYEIVADANRYPQLLTAIEFINILTAGYQKSLSGDLSSP